MNRELKIAIFHNLPNSGAIKALHDNLKFLKSKGHYIDVYTFDRFGDTFTPLNDVTDNIFIYHLEKNSFRKFCINLINLIIPKVNFSENSRFYFKYGDFEKIQKKIAEEIDSKDYDIVFVEHENMFTMTPAFLKYIKKPTVYYCQEPCRDNEKILLKLNNNTQTLSNKIYSRINQKYIKLDIEYAQFAKNILVNSYFSHETLLKIFGMNSKVCYLGIDTNIFHPLNIPRQDYILSVGVMMPHKGFDFIIGAVSEIDSDKRPKLVIVSYFVVESWKNYVIKLAKEKNVELEILEGISFKELVKIFNEAKLFVFGSYLEPFGLVSLESLACGTPVVAVKEGGVREIVQHGNNGFLSDRDEKVFAEYITKILDSQELWDKFSQNGIEYVNNFWTLKHSGQRLENHFYDILDKERK